jgi:dephospho-CoA kinase
VRVFGLTGGIASGKSTVADFFRARGVQVIDADQLAREVVEPGEPALAEIALRFPGVLRADGSLDRAALGERIFGDAGERAALNAITHPRVGARFLTKLAALEAAGETLVLYDVPLLIESGLQGAVEGVVLVTAPAAVQLQRLMARNGLTLAAARARIASQLPLASKRPFATWEIDNGGSLEQTRAQVETVLAAMRSMT